MQKDYFKDLTEIKDLMNKSSRFISLSGLSGILAGCYALIGAIVAYVYFIPKNDVYVLPADTNFNFIVLDLLLIALLSFITAIILTTRKAKQNEEKIWDATSKRLLFNFLIPLITGGIYIFIQLYHQHYGLSAALMLIFYGLSLVNASKFTLGNVKYLGYTEIILGLVCALFPGFGFYFWTLGFGVLHIVYGSLMYLQEKKK